MKKYEGLFILNLTGKEDGVAEILDRVGGAIRDAGGKVETVQKMERRNFSRVADKRHVSGFYANLVFELEPEALKGLERRFATDDDIFRVLFTYAPARVVEMA